jgi:DNA helicase-2/ATP-dependent DNA helicase PcrA
MGLNNKQQEAVDHVYGPLLILAGAGSGKTTVLCHRIGEMIEKNIDPDNILAVAFTNKAANEMKKRVSQKVGEEKADRMSISTFHAMCTKILRDDGDFFPELQNFQVKATSSCRQMMKKILEETPLSTGDDPDFFKASSIIRIISLLKNELVGADHLMTGKLEKGFVDLGKIKTILRDEIKETNFNTFKLVFKKYQDRLKNHNGIDVDDLLYYAAMLLVKNETVLDKYQEKFRFIMVDEYQDTNQAQYIFIKLLAQKYRNIGVVGDDSQSIYGFRGSDIRNILQFTTDYPEALEIKLEQNYRSTKTILEAANQVISNNKEQREKTLFTSNVIGEPIEFFEAEFSTDEAAHIAGKIKELVASGYQYKDIAIFYRQNNESSLFEALFPTMNIPFIVSSEAGFFEREEIKDILAYVKFTLNPNDFYSFTRMVNCPKRGIGKTSIDKIAEKSKGKSILEAIQHLDQFDRLNTKTKEGLEDLARVMEILTIDKEVLGASAFLSKLIQVSRYNETFEELENHLKKEKMDYLQKLVTIATELEGTKSSLYTVEQFIYELMKTDVDAQIENEDEFDRVMLSTIHSAKGLEFPIVFIVGMKEMGFPSPYAVGDKAIEEERRLCYVAFTRAKERLFLSYPKQYFLKIDKDNKEIKNNTASRFLSEFDQKYVKKAN